MAISKGTIKSGGSVVFPRTSIDNIVKSTDSATTYIADASFKIKPEYLTAATGTASGIVYNNDTDHLTITTGGISINTYTSNLSSATTAANLKKIPVVSAVKNYISTYTHTANNIPGSAVSGFATSATNAASAYVNSAGVIPNSALAAYDTITTIPAASTTVTLEPGKAYKIDATTTSKTLNISAFDAGKFGRESHIELFVANAGYVHTGENVTLVDALEPDAVNDCTVRFHDGHAIISVEDHVQAYMVNNTSTTNTSGSLLYGIAQTGDTYKFIGFRSELNTSTVPTGGGTATTIKHFVGNGMDVGPTISGAIKLNSNGTFRDCKLNGLIISAGTATLTDVLIPSGGTVSVSGGGLAISSVVGDSGTINLNGKSIICGSNKKTRLGGITLTGGLSEGNHGGGGVYCSGGSLYVSGCLISGCTAASGQRGGGMAFAGGTQTLVSCTFDENSGVNAGFYAYNAHYILLDGCTFKNNQYIMLRQGTSVTLTGRNVFDGAIIAPYSNDSSCMLYISSGAIIDMTGNSQAPVIKPGKGIIVDGGCTVINSAGASVTITGGTYQQINNDGTTA